jgi:Tfp pilus assembly protein PilF
VVRLQRGDYTGARADAEEVLQKNSGDIRAVRVVVAAYRAQKLPAKVEERLKTAVAEHPQSAPLQTLLGQWYMETRNLTAARKAFEAAQSADPKLFTAAFCLAQIEYMEKHLDAGRQRLQSILKADPQNVSALLMLGSWAAEAGDQEEAIQHYRAAVDADGGNVAALNNLAYTLAASEPDEALQYAQRAAELAPNNATVSDTLGWIYYKKLIYSTAVTYLQTAVAKEPTARRQYHLALSYLKSGQRDLGEKTLRLALQQDPKIATTERGW